jgi:hypothetical protein
MWPMPPAQRRFHRKDAKSAKEETNPIPAARRPEAQLTSSIASATNSTISSIDSIVFSSSVPFALFASSR